MESLYTTPSFGRTEGQAETCRKLREDGHEETIREKTGLVLDPYFSASKILWLLDNVDGAREAAEEGKLAVGTIDSTADMESHQGCRKETYYGRDQRLPNTTLQHSYWRLG